MQTHIDKQNKATVLIYILFLVTLSLVFASIIIDNFSYMSHYSNFSDIEKKLYNNIESTSKLQVDYNDDFNITWSGYTDNISCPSSITLSWSTQSSTISSSLNVSDSWSIIYCSWTYQSSWDLSIYFNTWYTDFIEADYDGFITDISSWIWDFFDSDLTHIDFSGSNYLTWDFIDDDFNSDDYKCSSTWSVVYPNWFQDDDCIWRKTLFWFVSPHIWFTKVFWSTSKTSSIIDENTNNSGTLNIKIWDVSSGILHFDIDKAYELMLIEFEKSSYDDYNELISSFVLTWSSISWNIWYLQNNWSLSETKTTFEYNFDFKDKDYAIFLKWTWTTGLIYNITWEDSSWSDIYLTPIDDSDPYITRYLWNEIIIDDRGRYLSKQIDVIYKK